MLRDSSKALSGNGFILRRISMKQRQFIGKFKKPTQKALAIFLVILFILSIDYFAFARGGRGGGRRGGSGSVRHHSTARHGHDRDRYKQRKKDRRHQRRNNHGSVHHSNSYDDNDDYNATACDDYGRNCRYDHYYDRCDCD
jgi:hypothetical protein